MESDKIEILLEKYFEGETTIAEEKELQHYFSTAEVPEHLQQYRSLFGFFSVAKAETSQKALPLQRKRRYAAWLSVAASVVILLGIGTFTYINYTNSTSQDLGTYDNPEEAFRETQKALALLSNQVNVGVGSVQYIEQYQDTKEKVFKE